MGEDLEDFVAKEVFVADEGLKIGLGQDIAESLEARGANLIQTHIQFRQLRCILKSLSKQEHALIANDVALDVQVLQGAIALNTLC